MVFNTSFLAFIQGLKLFSFRLRRDDDSCDRLNHHHTALFLLITSILISSKQYVGNPIHCWVPKEFSDPWQKYVNSYCWIKNTYVSPPSDEWTIPKHDERAELEINYYQWVPIVLLIQSGLFYFPVIIWRILNWIIGRDDDFVDRLNHWYTSMVLVVMAIFISAKQYFDDTLTCWVPNEFSKAWLQYVENYCWIQNTYFIPHDTELPKPSYRNESQIAYYQWVPYVLALQTLMFYFPRSLWRLLNWQSGINVQDVITKAMSVCTKIEEDPKPKEKKPQESKTSDEKKSDQSKKSDENKEEEPNVPSEIRDIAHHLEVTIESVENSQSNMIKSLCQMLACSFGSRKYGCYLLPLYLFTKVLYIINVIGQLFLLNSFIGTNYKFFGFQILRDLVQGKDWKSTGHFPRVTMCDFEIRNFGQRANYSVQCVLPINLFNEKIYIFIWFWIFVVSLFTVYSLFQWIVRMLSVRKTKFIRNILIKRTKIWTDDDDELLTMFLNNRLKSDGVFLIYLIYLNAGDLVTKELLDILWFRHKQKYGNDESHSNENYL